MKLCIRCEKQISESETADVVRLVEQLTKQQREELLAIFGDPEKLKQKARDALKQGTSLYFCLADIEMGIAKLLGYLPKDASLHQVK